MRLEDIEFTGVASETGYASLISEKHQIRIFIYEVQLTYYDDNHLERYKKAYELQAYFDKESYENAISESFTVFTKAEISSKRKILDIAGVTEIHAKDFELIINNK